MLGGRPYLFVPFAPLLPPVMLQFIGFACESRLASSSSTVLYPRALLDIARSSSLTCSIRDAFAWFLLRLVGIVTQIWAIALRSVCRIPHDMVFSRRLCPIFIEVPASGTCGMLCPSGVFARSCLIAATGIAHCFLEGSLYAQAVVA